MRNFIITLAALALAGPTYAAVHAVTFCVEFQTSFIDTNSGEDFWEDNSNRMARGVWLVVWENGTSNNQNQFVSDTSGCATVNLDDVYTYRIAAWSKAQVKGIDLFAYEDTITIPPKLAREVFYTAYQPTGPITIVLEIPATTQWAQLAVGTWAFNRNTAGLPAGTSFEFYDDSCCSAAQQIKASTFSKYMIAHEIGHAVGYRRDGNNAPLFDYSINNSCDGDNRSSGHSQTSAEWQSAAAVEGWADLYAAWLWNRKTESDCIYDRHYPSDFDLDGTLDNSTGVTDCEDAPAAGLPVWLDDEDLLEDWRDNGMCTSMFNHRGTQYDWMRFWWDMLTDEGVPFEDLVDIYSDMSPSSWDRNNSTPLATDDPVYLLESAAAANGYLSAYNNQKANGVDH